MFVKLLCMLYDITAGLTQSLSVVQICADVTVDFMATIHLGAGSQLACTKIYSDSSMVLPSLNFTDGRVSPMEMCFLFLGEIVEEERSLFVWKLAGS